MKVVRDLNDMAQIIMARIVTLDPVTKKMMIIPDQLSVPPCRALFNHPCQRLIACSKNNVHMDQKSHL